MHIYHRNDGVLAHTSLYCDWHSKRHAVLALIEDADPSLTLWWSTVLYELSLSWAPSSDMSSWFRDICVIMMMSCDTHRLGPNIIVDVSSTTCRDKPDGIPITKPKHTKNQTKTHQKWHDETSTKHSFHFSNRRFAMNAHYRNDFIVEESLSWSGFEVYQQMWRNESILIPVNILLTVMVVQRTTDEFSH